MLTEQTMMDLMGKDPKPRYNFIVNNANAVNDLDVWVMRGGSNIG